MDYEYKTIEEKMLALPIDLQRVLTSVDTPAIIQDIATENNLHIDQIGNLEEIVSLILLGLVPARNLASEISKRNRISGSVSLQISNEINDKIFKTIRSSLQKIQTGQQQPTPRPPLPPSAPLPPIQTPYKNPIGSVAPIIKPNLEQAGQFSIEKPPVGFSNQYKEKSIQPEPVLKVLEDPETNMIDHLLSTPVSETIKIERKIETPNPTTQPYTVDPYREQF
jgi:hypothetical protein